jgi:hypothetical protein
VFTTPIDVIQLDDAGERLTIIAFLHDLHQFLFDTPGGVAGNTQLAAQ